VFFEARCIIVEGGFGISGMYCSYVYMSVYMLLVYCFVVLYSTL
jgi:hypothetical protein